jgi:hypothetical protein
VRTSNPTIFILLRFQLLKLCNVKGQNYWTMNLKTWAYGRKRSWPVSEYAWRDWWRRRNTSRPRFKPGTSGLQLNTRETKTSVTHVRSGHNSTQSYPYAEANLRVYWQVPWLFVDTVSVPEVLWQWFSIYFI